MVTPSPILCSRRSIPRDADVKSCKASWPVSGSSNGSIAGFAYPHGALDADSRAAVQECGFAWACSTDSRPVSRQEYDPYALPRLGVVDWDGDAFERALQAVCA